MANGEMFANFDVRCWASNGMVGKLPEPKATLLTPRSGSLRQKMLFPAAAAAAMSLYLAAGGVAVQSNLVLGAVTSSFLNAAAVSQKSESAHVAISNFERETGKLLSGLASGNLPLFSAGTLAAAREAVHRRVSADMSLGVPEWMTALSTKVASLKD